MSFKYRFILSFVLLEVIFVLLIVSVNFVAITSSSKKLTDEKITSNVTFLEELLSVPVSIYDLATLDNLLEKTQKIEYINSIVVLDSQNKVLSKKYNFKHETIEDFLKNKTNRELSFEEETYEIVHTKLFEEDKLLGSLYLVFDTTENSKFIQNNRNNTIFIIILEIIISTFLSYIIGSRLTNMLVKLSSVAQKIGKNKYVRIPFQNKKDEIGILSKSMSQMQEDLKQRNEELKNTTSQLEEQKEHLQEQKIHLENANKAKDEFLANISHEIRTPLNAIIGFSDILKDEELPETQKKQANIISKSAHSLLSIINEILDFSKIASGKLEIVPEVSSTQELFTHMHTLFDAKASEKNITFHIENDLDIPNYLIFDHIRMQQVISNLLSNAIKFTPQNGEVWLRTKLVSKDNNTATIYIEVKDSGIGIPHDKLDLIFKPFSQVDGSVSKKYGGTGLGLTIISKILQLMNSKIHVVSKENKGSTFFFEISFEIANKKEENQIERKIEKVLKGEVLVAEDNPINQQLMEAMLSTLNLRVDFASDGNEAINMYENKNYDLIFMDINMPNCDGITATKAIREKELIIGKYTPIVALTANAIKGDSEKYKNAGMDQHISKPINFNTLKDTLEKYLS